MASRVGAHAAGRRMLAGRRIMECPALARREGITRMLDTTNTAGQDPIVILHVFVYN